MDKRVKEGELQENKPVAVMIPVKTIIVFFKKLFRK